MKSVTVTLVETGAAGSPVIAATWDEEGNGTEHVAAKLVNEVPYRCVASPIYRFEHPKKASQKAGLEAKK